MYISKLSKLRDNTFKVVLKNPLFEISKIMRDWIKHSELIEYKIIIFIVPNLLIFINYE
jgi:hypothetical protein